MTTKAEPSRGSVVVSEEDLEMWSQNRQRAVKQGPSPRPSPRAGVLPTGPSRTSSSSPLELPTRSSLRNLLPVSEQSRSEALQPSNESVRTSSVESSEETGASLNLSDATVGSSVVTREDFSLSNNRAASASSNHFNSEQTAGTTVSNTAASRSGSEASQYSGQDRERSHNRLPATSTISTVLPTASSLSQQQTIHTASPSSSSVSVSPSVTSSASTSRAPPLTQSNRVSSRLRPSAVAISHDDEDDGGTVHGEAYVQLMSGGNAISQLGKLVLIDFFIVNN